MQPLHCKEGRGDVKTTDLVKIFYTVLAGTLSEAGGRAVPFSYQWLCPTVETRRIGYVCTSGETKCVGAPEFIGWKRSFLDMPPRPCLRSLLKHYPIVFQRNCVT